MSRIAEVKDYWNNRTLEELKIKTYNTRKALEDAQKLITKNASELLQLDINSNDYLTKLKINTEYIRNAERTIRESTRELNILKLLLQEKESNNNYNFETEYKDYIQDNKENIETIAENVSNIDKDLLTNIIQSIRNKAGNIEEIENTIENNLEIKGDKASVNFAVVDGKTFSYKENGNSLVFV
jgi:hypothetical protein